MIKITVVSADGGRDSRQLNPGEPLLQGLLERGLRVPYCCTVGICGMCKADIDEGEVSLDKAALAALSDQELRDGRILLCSAKAVADSTLTLVNSGGAERPCMMKAVIEGATRIDQRWWSVGVRLSAGAVRRLLEKSQRLAIKGAGRGGRGFELKGWAGGYRDGLLDVYLDERVAPVPPLSGVDVVVSPEIGGSGVTPVTESPALTLVVAQGDGVVRVPGLFEILALGGDQSARDLHLIHGSHDEVRRWLLERHPGELAATVHQELTTLAAALTDRVEAFRRGGGAGAAIRAQVYGAADTNAQLRKVLLDAGLKPWKINVFST